MRVVFEHRLQNFDDLVCRCVFAQFLECGVAQVVDRLAEAVLDAGIEEGLIGFLCE